MNILNTSDTVSSISELIIKKADKLTLSDFDSDSTDFILDRLNALSMTKADNSEDIAAKLEVLLVTSCLSDRENELDKYRKAWLNNDADFIIEHTSDLFADLKQEGINDSYGEWLTLLCSIELDILKYKRVLH